LSKLLKNSYVQTAILGIILVGGVFAFFFGLKAALRTEYPGLVVVSPSMVPTLNVGDIIIIQGGFKGSEIFANYTNGDIIVFRNYLPGGPRLSQMHPPDELFVHRAVSGSPNASGFWFFTTKGDGNWSEDYWKVPENYVVGKVVGRIPYLGNVPLFVRTPTGMTLIIGLFLFVLLLEFLPEILRKRKPKPPVNTLSTDKHLWVVKRGFLPKLGLL